MRSYVYLMIDQEKTAQRQKGVCFILPPLAAAVHTCAVGPTSPSLNSSQPDDFESQRQRDLAQRNPQRDALRDLLVLAHEVAEDRPAHAEVRMICERQIERELPVRAPVERARTHRLCRVDELRTHRLGGELI